MKNINKKLIIVLALAIILILAIISYFFFRNDTLVLNEAKSYDYAEMGTIEEEVHISSDGVILKNAVINNDLYIDEEVLDGHVELHNVEVKGTLYVYGGGLETILIQDGMIFQLIGYVDGRVMATENTVISDVIVKEPGMVLENDETAELAYVNVSIEIDEPSEEDKPVVLDGSFGDVEVNPGNNAEIATQTRIKNMVLKECPEEGCKEQLKTKVRVREQAQIENMNINHNAEVDNQGEIEQRNYGENMTASGEVKTEEGDTNYKPQVTSEVGVSVAGNGDYTLDFETNANGTMHYIVQPWFESSGITVSKEDIIAGKGYNFTLLFPEEAPPMEDPANYVVSAKSVSVTNNKATGKGYMGDKMGVRPPADDAIEFSSVIWYVFEDENGNFSEVGKVIYK